MTPEERQLLTTLADRIKSTPPQQKDMEADQLLRQLAQERPDALYILAQTVLMQDFALRNAQAQIEDLQHQLSERQQPQERSSGSFLGGLFGGGREQPQQPRPSGSVPNVNPWGPRPSQGQPSGDYPPPPQAAGYPGPVPGGPVMQPSQTSGFLRNAATTAAGVAGGALLFQGINSLFSGHSGGLLGGASLGGMTPSLSEPAGRGPSGAGDRDGFTDADYGGDQGGDEGGLAGADYDDGDYGGDDYA